MHPNKDFTVYGEDIGILMLDTDFHRPVGDVGNAQTFDFPVKYKVIKSATPDKIVARGDMARTFLPLFISAAQELEKEGARAIVTSCGFLSVVQDELASSINIPLITSSLLLVPMVQRMIGPSRKVGVLSANAEQLSNDHLRSVGIDEHVNVIMKGMEKSEAFNQMVFQNKHDPDFNQIGQDVFETCKKMKNDHPDMAAIVFECTNLQPYAKRIQSELRIPVFGIIQAVNMLKTACGDHWK